MTPPAPGTAEVAERLAGVRRRIEAAGGDPGRVRIVAVTKGHGPDAVRAALGAGCADIGENYAQELVAKAEALGDDAAGVRWHFIGHLQSNKVRLVAGLVHLWHTVDRASLGAEVARRTPYARVLVQVNVTGEAAKGGCAPGEAAGLVEALRRDGLDVAGLMTIGPLGAPEDARPGFRLLSSLADDLGLPERSMGMSDDLEVAVEEGATIVRVGTLLFGARPGRPGAGQ